MMMITLRRKLKRGEVQNKTKVKSPTGDKFAISEEGVLCIESKLFILSRKSKRRS